MKEDKQPQGIDPKKYYSVSEAANALGVHRSTIWRWVSALKIRFKTKVVNSRKVIPGSELLKLLKYI